uniref:Uncharacterized protein n=1 Tax=Sphaerodactylus townsendi TaxID=933632 RepID=A0ACB8F5D6_9SAUR
MIYMALGYCNTDKAFPEAYWDKTAPSGKAWSPPPLMGGGRKNKALPAAGSRPGSSCCRPPSSSGHTCSQPPLEVWGGGQQPALGQEPAMGPQGTPSLRPTVARPGPPPALHRRPQAPCS